MSPDLQAWLRQAGRQRAWRAARRGLRGGLWTCAGLLAASTLARLAGALPAHLAQGGVLLALLALPLGPLGAVLRLPRGDHAAALWVDRRLGGQSAFSTWLEGAAEPPRSGRPDEGAQQRLQAWCLARLPHCRAALAALPSPAWPRAAFATALLALLMAGVVEWLPAWQAAPAGGFAEAALGPGAAGSQADDGTGFGAAPPPSVAREEATAAAPGAPRHAAHAESGGASAHPARAANAEDAADAPSDPASASGRQPAGRTPADRSADPAQSATTAGFDAHPNGAGQGDGVGMQPDERLAARLPQRAVASDRRLGAAARTAPAGSVLGRGGPYDAARAPAGSPRASPGGAPQPAAARAPRARPEPALGAAQTLYLNAWKQANRP